MNKIGLRINKVYEGSREVLCVNSDEWKRKCVDLRPVIRLFDQIDKGKYVTLLSFSREGAYVTSCIPIFSGKQGDHVAAWIYIPNNVSIKGEEILQLISAVKDGLKKGSLDELKHIFGQEYDETVSIPYTPSSSEAVYAKRRVPSNQMVSLLGDKLYQTYYGNYQYIIIEDDNSPKVSSPKVVDITDKKLDQLCIFLPPRQEDLKDGVSVRFHDAEKTPFTDPVRKKKGDIVDLVFERPGFLPVHHKEQVTETRHYFKMPKNAEWKIEVDKSRFRIYANFNSEDLGGRATIIINGKPLVNSPLQIKEGEAKKATVEVSVDNFKPEKKEVDLTNGRPVHFSLHRAVRTHEYHIELPDDPDAKMTLRSKSLPASKSESPLKGYEVINSVLRFTNDTATKERDTATKERAIGFLMAIMTGVVVWGAVALWDMIFADDPTPNNKEQQYSPSTSDYTQGNTNSTEPQGDNKDSAPSISKAIAYLDNAQGEWVRDSLEKYPELAGLFDEMNEYNFDGVLSRKSELGESTMYTEVANAIKINKHKLITGKYCNDNKITLSTYITRLNKDEKMTTAPSTTDGALTDVAKKHDKQNQSNSTEVEPKPSTKGRAEAI